MQFLDTSECETLAVRAGLDPRALAARKRMSAMKNAAVFFFDGLDKAPDIAARLLDHCGDFTWALLWAQGVVFGESSGDAPAALRRPPYTKWRRAAGEGRHLHDAPGHLFEPHEKIMVAEVIEFAIYGGWDAILIARPLRCIIRISHDNVLEIQSRHNLSALAKALARLGLRRGDFRLR